MERKDWKNLKRIIDISPESVKDQRWFFEAQLLIEKNLGKMPNGWIDIDSGKTANAETWSEQYEGLTSAFPQFDFDENTTFFGLMHSDQECSTGRMYQKFWTFFNLVEDGI